MASSTRLIATLKRELKHRGITYRDLALALELSESTVKHMFSAGNFSLRRLDEICDVLKLDFAELVAIGEEQTARIEQLTLEQEREIVADSRLLVVAYCLVNYWRFEDILNRYTISETEGVRYLRKLDRMGIIELLPGDRVRLRIANSFQWRPDGPIDRFFTSRVQSEFFRHDFTSDGALRIAKNGQLSKRAQAALQDKLRSIGQLFDDAVWEERKLPADKRHGVTMVLAIRDWVFEAFRELERPV